MTEADDAAALGKPWHDEELVRAAFLDMRNWGLEVEKLPSTTIWFQNLIVCLLNALLKEGQSLSAGLEKSTTLSAWACRNLMELRIYAEFSLRSESNAKAVVDDVWIDAIETFVAMRHWLKLHGADASALSEVFAGFGAGKGKLGDSRQTPLKIDEMAAAIGFDSEYRLMNKITSKLVHQTAYSIMGSAEAPERLTRKIMFDWGVRFALQAFGFMKAHVELFGVEPPRPKK
jgi:hypothetical protein